MSAKSSHKHTSILPVFLVPKEKHVALGDVMLWKTLFIQWAFFQWIDFIMLYTFSFAWLTSLPCWDTILYYSVHIQYANGNLMNTFYMYSETKMYLSGQEKNVPETQSSFRPLFDDHLPEILALWFIVHDSLILCNHMIRGTSLDKCP